MSCQTKRQQTKQKKDGSTLRQSQETRGGGKGNDPNLLCINTWRTVLRQEEGGLGAEVIHTVGWWVSAMPLMLPHCPSSNKESLQTHQHCQAKGCWLASIKSIKSSCRQLLASYNQAQLSTWQLACLRSSIDFATLWIVKILNSNFLDLPLDTWVYHTPNDFCYPHLPVFHNFMRNINLLSLLDRLRDPLLIQFLPLCLLHYHYKSKHIIALLYSTRLQ